MIPKVVGLLLSAAWLLLLAPQACAHGEVHEVIAHVTQQISATPNDAALYLQRAELYRVDADWAAAEADYARAERLDPNLATVDLARGRMFVNSKRFDQARQALDRYIERAPSDSAGYETRAEVFVKVNEPRAAAEDYRRAIAFSRQPAPDLYLQHAQSLSASGKSEEARATLEQGLTRLGPLATLTLAAIELDRAAGRFDDAIRRIDAVAEKLSRKERWLVRRAEILEQAGRGDEARDSFLLARASIDSLPEERRAMAANAELLRKIDTALARAKAPRSK